MWPQCRTSPFQQVSELNIERWPVVYILVDTIVEDKMVSADVTNNFLAFGRFVIEKYRAKVSKEAEDICP
jgi:hypothetical protein